MRILLVACIYLLSTFDLVFAQGAPNKAQALHDQALEIAAKGETDEALALLSSTLGELQDSTWKWRALVLVVLGALDPDPLVKLLEQRVQEPGGERGPSFAQAYLRYQTGDLEGARQAIQRCLDAGYHEPLALNLAGAIETSSNRPNVALPLIRQALAAAPDLEVAFNNLFETRARSVLLAAVDAWSPDTSSEDFQTLAEKLEAQHGDAPAPLAEVFIAATHQGLGRRALVIAIENDARGLVQVAFDPPLPGSQAEPPLATARLPYESQLQLRTGQASKWQLIDAYRDLLLLKRWEITGPHHAAVTYFHLDGRQQTGYVNHGWQVWDSIWDEDFDHDGTPELVLDFSDYYIKSFAAGIVDRRYTLLRYNLDSGSFQDLQLTAELPDAEPDVKRINAQAVAFALRGDWASAQTLLQSVPTNPAPGDFAWNERIITLHEESLASQHEDNSSPTTGVLLGRLPEEVDAIDWQELNAKVVRMRLLDLALAKKWPPARLRALLHGAYSSGHAVADLQRAIPSESGETPFWGLPTRVQVWPEIRALENAALTYANNRLIYVPLGTASNAYIKILDSPDMAHDAAILARAVPSDLSPFVIDYAPSTVSERMWSDMIVDQAFADRKPVPILQRIQLLTRRKDFEQAEQMLAKTRSIWRDDPVVRSVLNLFQRVIDMRYGRYYDVVRSLETSGEDDLQEIASFEAFERLGMTDRAEAIYRDAVEPFEDNADQQADNAGRASEGYLGLARIALARGDAATAREKLRAVVEIAHRHFPKPSYHRPYLEAVLSLARAEFDLDKVEIARAYNSLAHHAVTQTDQGTGWMQSAGQYDFEHLPEVFFNDFLIARRAGDDRLAMAYLAAAISVVQDIYRMTPEDAGGLGLADRLGLSETAHRIYREAVRFHLDLGKIREAFVLLNAVKETTALQHLLRRTQRGDDQRSVLLTIPYEDLVAPIRGTDLTVVQYLVQSDSLGIFMLHSDGSLGYTQRSLERGALKTRIDSALDLTLELGALGERAVLDALLRDLYRELVAPITSRLPQGAPLLILPDREIHGLPFEMLLDPSGRFLIEKHPVSYGTSLSALGSISTAPRRVREDVLLVHSPDTDGRDPLLATAVEVEQIRDLLNTSSVRELAGASATRPAFASAAARATLIHVATHSTADSFHPDRSSILLSERQRQEITLADFLAGEVRFERSPLVVLSSCSSAAGKIYEEGAVSLASGLLLSGASTVVVTEWEVVDKQAPELMGHFYRNYSAHQDAAAALRAAKVELIRRGSHPQVWAPYVVHGRYWRKPQ